jgi:hypothetical protein
MTEPWPPAPVAISGTVVLKLLGVKLAVITLDLAIVAKHRLARWVEAGGQVHTVSPGAGLDELRGERIASVGAPHREAQGLRLNPRLKGDGQGPAGDGQLEEILHLLEKTSKMLE